MSKRYAVRLLVLAIAVALAMGGTDALAQGKTAKQSQSLSKSAEDARKQLGDVLTSLDKLLQGYNSIIDGSAKNPQSAYKKLAGDLKSTEKMIQSARKSTDALKKEAQKFFDAWEKDLEEFSNEDLKQKSKARLETAKADYASLGETLRQARDLFAPVVQNLNDQILFLGRDLSPEAIADLSDEAESLNAQVVEVEEKVRSLLATADTESLEQELDPSEE